ncbi:MAG TPA: AgmX/PglI C-terminal domain-containing protein, partial [Caldimonas sp.]|nr:AgmX/PglI C-terminal domain-containing protein [Caldimonas sp.]
FVKVTKPKLAQVATVSPSLRRTSAGSIAKPAAPATANESDATKLAASTVANLVKQWQSQLDLCYTEYGLKLNPALTGAITVRLTIRPSGEVGSATFARHKWSGAGGAEAESCMRGRVMAWMFPPASTPSAHEFTVAFAP